MLISPPSAPPRSGQGSAERHEAASKGELPDSPRVPPHARRRAHHRNLGSAVGGYETGEGATGGALGETSARTGVGAALSSGSFTLAMGTHSGTMSVDGTSGTSYEPRM